MKLAFNNSRCQDQINDSDTYDLFNESGEERIKPGVLGIGDSNYLYHDTNADRYNSGKDFEQKQGQPKGLTPDLGPVNSFEKSNVIDENEITSFNKQSKIIEYILMTIKPEVVNGF